jgi:site-specific recombinase XerC
MQDLEYELGQLARRNKDGSFVTQKNRRMLLQLCARQLHAHGWQQMHAGDIKGRHVDFLLQHWQASGVSDRTIRNRLSVLRWWCEKVGRAGVMPASNASYQLAPRQYVAKVSKARELPREPLAQVQDTYVRMSLELQEQFGLRREESIKIKPWQADEGAYLRLQASWTKGGRPRRIPILTEAQRDVLDRAKALVKLQAAALIRGYERYATQLNRYTYWCRQAGLNKLHGLRHAYAQRRFLELAGFPCPACGGPSTHALTPEQREADEDARMLLTEEMGHQRTSITAAYLGR